jgi:hypothetical protein
VILAISHALGAHEALGRPDALSGFLEVVHSLIENGVFVSHARSIRSGGILRSPDCFAFSRERLRPTPAWTAGCSLATLSSPSTTLMARSSRTSACRAAAVRIADSPASIAHATYTGGPRPSGPGYAELRL